MTRQFNAPVLIGGETYAAPGARSVSTCARFGWVALVGQRKPNHIFEALDVHGADRSHGVASAGDYA
ncbi:MAG: hypothetical protein IPN17_35045, partial [Deltaproteobacteria bacterium]|nr:hypothetical protein [Deltaproteobacteria bacterium]